MTPRDLYQQARKLGLDLAAQGDKLAVSPKGKCPPEFAEVLRQHKGELLGWLTQPPCPGWEEIPPADLPLNPTMPRPTPEDRDRVTSYVFRQGCDRPGRLCAWLQRREADYYAGHGRRWDCALHTYAAARDAACWQLNRTEAEVWTLLETTLEVAQG